MAFANVIDNELLDDEMQPLTLDELQFEDRITSRFKDQIDLLESQIGDVPLGWHPIFRDAIRSLRAIDCPKRNGIEFSEPVFGRGTLTVAVYYAITDKVASGILYKLSKRAECTCQRCGRTYGTSFRKGCHETLCSRCYVRVSLSDAISQWVRPVPCYADPLIEFDTLPPNIKLLIPSYKIRTLSLASSNQKIDYVRPADLEHQRPKLEAMKRYLDETEVEN